VRGKGGPDFKIMKAAMILGYAEVKTIGENLDQVLKSKQIDRYKELSNNILVTDYLQFIWLKDGKVNGREPLAYPHDLEGRPKKPRDDRVKAVSDLLRGFFSNAPEGIGRAQQLALALATRSHFLRDYLDEELRRQEKEHAEGRLYGLFQIFRDQVFHELKLPEFADAFAQMLAYGLFLAKLNSDSHEVTLQNARQYVPGSFRLIRELVDFLGELERDEYQNVRWVVEEVLSIVNGLKLDEIHEDLSFKHRKAISRKVRAKDEEEHRLFERDPFIYFYEDFLAKYDAKMKKSRGVYYTPPPIVNFIVRAIDDILKDTFGIKDGLADNKRVTVLDFACGTGTFLLEVFERIFDNIGGPGAGRAGPIVREHLLKNIFGFEYLIAPYTIAHLKLSQYLSDQGHALKDNERLQIFLTNTVEPIEPQANLLLPAISAEVKAAQAVKEQPILVITGNPPYSASSKNRGAWITAAIEPYKMIDGKPFGEKKHWLHDDYVKFIRFAQLKMDAIEEGVVGVITNNSFLDNPTFRGMRQSLLSSFNQLWVFDLNGSTRRKEQVPAEILDENVFDIEQGVAITLLVKRPGLERGVWHADLWGRRLEKYLTMSISNMQTVNWHQVSPASPFYFFKPRQSEAVQEVYKQFHSVREMMPTSVTGIVTARDQLAIGINSKELEQAIEMFLGERKPALSDTDMKLKNTRGWNREEARKALRNPPPWRENIKRVDYRPFDQRWIAYDRRLIDWGRWELMPSMLEDNISLNISRQVRGGIEWRHALVGSNLFEHTYVSNRTSEIGYCFPLRVKGAENLSQNFRAFIDSRYEHHYTPEEILGYIYAILHAPTYRTRYVEFLRIDFPRVPFPQSADHFEGLSLLGWELVQAHLLRALPRPGLGNYHGKGDHTVESVSYASADQSVAINKTQSFKPVPQEVWDFHIGGYRVVEKYLKSRKGRKLTLEEINNVSAITDSLAFTIAQMARIDEAYRSAFPGG
jgi:predicted helicase